ncbi:MAG: adenylosuccinate synthetase [Candidatus Gracilibacteria bacterium]|jgi:adenylosuccinate synthase
MNGYSDIVIGLQYGDEGKARVIDDMASDYTVVARFNGGANAGHTIEAKGLRLALRQVPSGVLYESMDLYVGSGCVIDIIKLAEEITNIEAQGIILKNRLRFSPQAGLVQPHHILMDTILGKEVGTTKNGIGPAYADRALRMNGKNTVNLRLCDLLDNEENCFSLMQANYDYADSLYHFPSFDLPSHFTKMRAALEKVKDFFEEDVLYLYKKAEVGAKVLFEGAQSYMLDVNKGSVPFVTSSATCAPAAYTGGDLPPNFHHKTIGVVKALMSRVGHGPFVSEFGGKKSEDYCMAVNENGDSINNRETESILPVETLLQSEDDFEVGKAFRVLSREYGTVTGRPRRIGILDLVQLSHAVKSNGVEEIVITKCDLLQFYSKTKEGKIPLVVGYELEGKNIDYIPASTAAYARVRPIYSWEESFTEDLTGMRTKEELPKNLLTLLQKIETQAGCRIRGISVGPNRDQYISMQADRPAKQ